MNILFRCTGSCCGSQMAEDWAKQNPPAVSDIKSPGMNPRAIAVMATGSKGEVMDVFRSNRDEVRKQVQEIIDHMFREQEGAAW